MQEIERKFLIKRIPNLFGVPSIYYERYFLKINKNTESRITKKGSIYELEEKIIENHVSNKINKRIIAQYEFESMRKNCSRVIQRDGYFLQKNPNVSIKIYHGDYLGLIRAEVEFQSIKEANAFIPFDWMGEEITQSELGRDSRLISLSNMEFRKLLKKYEA